MVNYKNIFLQKTGQFEIANPWNDTKVGDFLDSSAIIASTRYATPWGDFDSVPTVYKYPLVLFAAIEYWWAKTAEFVSKYDMQIAGSNMQGTNQQKSSVLFDRAMKMVTVLQGELESIGGLVSEGSGDFIVGDLVKRSKFTGNIVPRSDDPAGDWLS